MAFDERKGAIGEAPSEACLIGVELDHLLAVVQRQRRHLGGEGGVVARIVVGVGDAEPLVEAVAARVTLRAGAEGPLAHPARGVAARAQHLRQEPLVLVNAVAAGVVERALQIQAVRVGPGEQGRARGGADRLRYVETGEAGALPREAVEVRGPETFGALHAEVSPAHIIRDDQDDVWRRRGRGGRGGAAGGETGKGERGEDAGEQGRAPGPRVGAVHLN